MEAALRLIRKSEELKAIIYTGPSMNPTLKNLDKLFYAPYKNSILKPGDIVVFFDRDQNLKIIHRVISVNGMGIVTRGDNNSQADASIHHPDQIIGRIIYGERHNRKMRIYNGIPGTAQAACARWIRKIKKSLCIILKPPYYLLAGKLKLPLSEKVLTFQRPEGKELQLVMGKVVVARQLPGEGWQIRPPFRLFLDESSLPSEADRLSGIKRNGISPNRD
jgi:hypothetical protein